MRASNDDRSNTQRNRSTGCVTREPDYDIDQPVPAEWVDMKPVDTRPGAVIRPMNQYAPEAVRWLEPGRIAMGKLTLIAGDPGLGKSFMTLELAARVSRGDIGRKPGGLSGRAVIMSAEDDAGDTLVPRLSAMCARLSRVHFIEGMRALGSPVVDLPQLDRDTDRLIEAIQALGDVSLVVIDPISAYMGRADSHNNAEVRTVLAQLARLAQVTGAAVVCVTHLNKDSSGKRAVYRAMGSLAFTAAARTVHLVTKHPRSDDDPHAPRKRVVSMVKNNLGPIVPARVFVIEEGVLVWLDERIERDADELDAAGDDAAPSPRPTLPDGGVFHSAESKAQDAIEFLMRILDPGPRKAQEVFERGAAQGLSRRTLERTKSGMGVASFKRGDVWYWSRDAQDQGPMLREAIEPTPDEPGHGVTYGDNGFF